MPATDAICVAWEPLTALKRGWLLIRRQSGCKIAIISCAVREELATAVRARYQRTSGQ